MEIKAMTLGDFFTYLKTNPDKHTIPKRYVTRIRTLVNYYFIGWHHRSQNKQLNEKFSITTTKAVVLNDVDYVIFASMPQSGKGIAEHLKNTVDALLK